MHNFLAICWLALVCTVAATHVALVVLVAVHGNAAVRAVVDAPAPVLVGALVPAAVMAVMALRTA